MIPRAGAPLRVGEGRGERFLPRRKTGGYGVVAVRSSMVIGFWVTASPP